MEDQFQLLFDKMKNEILNQTIELKDSITNNIMERLDEKLQPIITENRNLKIKVENLEKEVESLKRGKKQNNLIMFGVNEGERSTQELIQNTIHIFKTDLDIQLQEHEINKIYRLGRGKSSGKPRPILISFTSEWKKNEVMGKKKNFKNVYVTEDYTKEVIEKRKTLQAQLKEEREKGNIAYLKFDKLVVKGKNTNINKEKRKRETSSSPQNNAQPRKQQTLMPPINNRPNAFDVMRIRANSLSSLPAKTTTNKE
ncbi:uncharacterized protein LOC123689741 [Pieris rapae]|uniref:uncharacterized protein LOC123689741 n=1 Tax=Pieris rapae TaxID=64459 RepID=UPI001E27F3C8|nr:uncharacterized protein LOC123689741 [Pieris rapae]